MSPGDRGLGLRRLVDFDLRSLSPQTHALKAILERLEPHKPQPTPTPAEPAATRVFVRGVRLVDVHIIPRWKSRRRSAIEQMT